MFEVGLIIYLKTELSFSVVFTIVFYLLSDRDNSAFFVFITISLSLWLVSEDFIKGSVSICEK